MKQTYIIRSGNTNFYKIGVTTSIKSRLKKLQCGNPIQLKLIALAKGDSEWELSNAFRKNWIMGEWFSFNKKDLKAVFRLMGEFSVDKVVIVF